MLVGGLRLLDVSPGGDVVTKRLTLGERMAARTQRTDGCWIWTGNVNPQHGYGRLGINGRNHSAHRLAYELAKGPIPDGLVIDHTCHNADRSCAGGSTCQHRRCVNPDHLEAVLHRVNTLRGVGIPAQHARSTTCPRGHVRDEQNTIIQRGHRLCRQCRDLRMARHREKQRVRPPRDPNRCDRGHEWTEANTYHRPGVPGRQCRACHRDRERNRRAAA